MNTNFLERLKIVIDEKAGGKPTVFAKKAGIPPGTFQAYLSGRIPKAEQLIRLRETYGISIDWLLTGEGSISSDRPATQEVAEAPASFVERRLFNRQSGLTREETELLARWLAGDQEAKALLVEWARARVDDSFQDASAAELIEVVAKALASFLLNKRKRESAKGSPPGG